MGITSTPEEICRPRFKCLFDTLLGAKTAGRGGPDGQIKWKYDLTTCQNQTNAVEWNKDDLDWNCTILLLSAEYDPNQHLTCESDYWDLTPFNWNRQQVDSELQLALEGGTDANGYFWSGRLPDETFSETINRQFRNRPRTKCVLADDDACVAPLDCGEVGPFSALGLGWDQRPVKIGWAYLLVSALGHINTQLSNQYNELKDAIQSLGLDTFSIDEFFPEESQNTGLLNSLAGLSGILTILGGFVPVIGPAIEAAGTIASGVGTFLSNLISSTDPLEAQKIFSETVKSYYAELLGGFEAVAEKLFAGEPIPGPDVGPRSNTIFDMLRNGTWADPKTISKVSDLNTKIRKEMLARAIDSLWKTPTKNKLWVLFTDLQAGNDIKACLKG